MHRYLIRSVPFVAGAIMFMSQVGPNDAVANLGKWWEHVGGTAPSWLLAPRADTIAFLFGLLTLILWTWLYRERLRPYALAGGRWVSRRAGFVDGAWTWRLRSPWESTVSTNATEPVTHPTASYEQSVAFSSNVKETLAACLLALGELISKPVTSARDAHAQALAFQALRSQIIDYVREKMSASEAYHLANPGMRIGVTDPDAFNAEHNSLLQSMREFRRDLDSMYQRHQPLPAARPLARVPEPVQPPFLIRYAGGREYVRVAIEVGEGGNDFYVVKVEVVNARPVHVSDIEVFLSGETHYINLRKPLREEIPRIQLTNRRQVSHMNIGQSEEYVVLSRHVHEPEGPAPETFWGDHKFVLPMKRIHAPQDAQHFITITVLSPTTAPLEHRLLIIVTGERGPHILPIDPKARRWIWNG